MGKHKTKRKSRKHTIKKGGRDPPDIGLLKSELARQKEETAHYIEKLTDENEQLNRKNARLEIEKRDIEHGNLVCLSQITTLRRENAELHSENEFLNEENDNLLNENNKLKKKEIEA